MPKPCGPLADDLGGASCAPGLWTRHEDELTFQQRDGQVKRDHPLSGGEPRPAVDAFIREELAQVEQIIVAKHASILARLAAWQGEDCSAGAGAHDGVARQVSYRHEDRWLTPLVWQRTNAGAVDAAPSEATSDGPKKVGAPSDSPVAPPREGKEPVAPARTDVSKMDLLIELHPGWKAKPQACSQLPETFRRQLMKKAGSSGKPKMSSFHFSKAGDRDGGWKVLPVRPSSTLRVWWETAGMLALTSDMIFVPLELFNPPPGSGPWSVFQLLMLAYWTLDIPATFLTGFYAKDGSLELRFSRIAAKYCWSWFVPDAVIVSFDWVMTMLNYGGAQRLSRILRASRIFRSVRILRLLKFRYVLMALLDRVSSERVSIMVTMCEHIILLLGVNHVIACLWYHIGTGHGMNHWVNYYGVSESHYMVQYLYAMHWSLTQFTPASSGLHPQNDRERVFAVLMLTIAMITFTSILSSITASMTKLRGLNAEHMTQAFQLRKFLSQNKIGAELSGRIVRYVEVASDMHRKSLRRAEDSDIALLKLLNLPLKVELRKAIFEPLLLQSLPVGGYFQKYKWRSVAAMAQICFTAVTSQWISRADTLFHTGTECSRMYTAISGALFYERHRGVRLLSGTRIPRLRHVPLGWRFCEAALWMLWTHRGKMNALTMSEIIAVDADKFREASLANFSVADVSLAEGRAFLAGVRASLERHGYVWDLPDDIMYADTGAGTQVMEFLNALGDEDIETQEVVQEMYKSMTEVDDSDEEEEEDVAQKD